MPYRRKYGKKRSSYRRKAIRKRRYKRRTTIYKKADGYHSEKINKRVYLNVLSFNQNVGRAQMGINWMASGASGAGDVYFTGGGGSEDPQFLQCRTMYREYFITGVKIEYRPIKIEASGDGNAPNSVAPAGYTMGPFSVGTTMDTLANVVNLNDQSWRASLDFKSYDPCKPFKRYYRVASYARTKLIKWRNCRDAVQGANGLFNILPNCVTVLDLTTNFLPLGATVGYVDVTYYLKFRFRTQA